jgi:hypothetical protein
VVGFDCLGGGTCVVNSNCPSLALSGLSVVAYSGASCAPQTQPVSPVVTPSTSPESIASTNGPSSGGSGSGLSSGALAGIIIGVVVAGVLAALLIALLSRCLIRRNVTLASSEIKHKELADLNLREQKEMEK